MLVLAFGSATKAVRWLNDSHKSYLTTVKFGAETSTDDAQGVITRTAPLPVLTDEVELNTALRTGVGETIAQVPPAVSALKRDGVRDHQRVRRGETIEREPRAVDLHEVVLLESTPDTVRVEVTCGPGFYVRAWARDLGRMLGSAAHLVELRRTRTAGVTLANCHTIDALRAIERDAREALLQPFEPALQSVLPSVTVKDEDALALCHGKRPVVEVEVALDQEHALLQGNGTLVCVARPYLDEEQLRWRVVRGFASN